MAYDFLGTLSITELQDFRSFLEAQIVDIDDEINFLYVEMNNLKQTLASFAEASSHFGDDSTRFLYETQLRDVIKIPKQDDSPAASIMAQVKKPFISTIKYKLERNEFKMKKLLDAIEQTKESIDRKAIAKSQTRALLNELEGMFIDKNSTFLFRSDEEMKNYFQGIPRT
jgi:hypothetical protein